MFINKLQLKNFKRFTDLTVDLVSQPAKGGENQEDENSPKLVLLIGANGSGKSCIFDAFEVVNQALNQPIPCIEDEYVCKSEDSLDFRLAVNGSEGHLDIDHSLFAWTNSLRPINKYKFYGRTAFRNIAYLDTNRHAGEFGKQKIDTVVEENLDRTNQFIDEDQRWETDIVYACTDNIRREELVSSINNSLNNIFSENLIGKFQIESIKVDIGGLKSSLALEVLIKKGKSIFPYEYLSAGEKQLFAILLNLYLRKKYLENTIVYLDEIDLHLNTAIQCDLLKEITENIIPDNSQLWTASHSLGFIDYARDYNKGAIIDFDNLDFDQAQILKPVNKNDSNKPYFKVALGEDFLANLIEEIQDKYSDQIIAFSEGDNCQFLEKAQKLLGIKLKIKFLDGQGKDNLKAVFHQLKSSKEKILFIFDNDAKKEFEACTIYKNTKLIPFLLPKNEANDLCTVGIENLFDEKFFEESFPDRDKFYFKQNDNKGGYSYQLDKAKFCKYICQRNNPEDFSNFKQLFEQIEEVLK